MASIKLAYAASSDLTVTNLNSLATSSTWTAGWESGAVDNSSNLYLDYLLSGKITVGNSATAGQIRVYVIPQLDDTTWPDVFDGTESTETITDTEIRDGVLKLAAAIDVDADGGTDDVYFFAGISIASLFGGVCPKKFGIFITHSSGVNLAASGNQVAVMGIYANST